MPAFIIVEISIRDPHMYEEYKKLTPDSLKPFGGKFIVRGGALETLEGGWDPERIVVLEFESREQAKAWWDSELYGKAKLIRQASAETRMILVEGV